MRRCKLQFDDETTSVQEVNTTPAVENILVKASDVNEMRQGQFNKTVEHVAQLFCKRINKELEDICDTKMPGRYGRIAIRVDKLIPDGYEVPEGMFEWEGIRQGIDFNDDILKKNIISMIKDIFYDWAVGYQGEYNFCSGEFIFDSRFKAVTIDSIISVDEFAKSWQYELDKMVGFFVDAIANKISTTKGLQAPSKIVIKTINSPKPISLTINEQQRVYERICNQFTDSGWKVVFCRRLDSFGKGKGAQYQKTQKIDTKCAYNITSEPIKSKKEEE